MLDIKLKNAVDSWSNSFMRPSVPPKLASKSNIKQEHDDGAKLIYLKFVYGIQDGKFSTRPTDVGLGNKVKGNVIEDLKEESLWLYSTETSEGFDPKVLKKSKENYTIGTGDTRKCSTCRGTGKVRCKSCGGKIRWTERSGDDIIERVCSCGDGKQMCSACEGYGDVEIIILVEKKFELFETKNSQYTGKVPQAKIKKITGEIIYEQVYNYTDINVHEKLVGGADPKIFDVINRALLEAMKDHISKELGNQDININNIYDQVDTLFESLPNPGEENKLLEHEGMPIRVMIRVENAPVKQIDYEYKKKDYSLWIYGKENSIWSDKLPSSFNYKIIVILGLILASLSSLIFLDVIDLTALQ